MLWRTQCQKISEIFLKLNVNKVLKIHFHWTFIIHRKTMCFKKKPKTKIISLKSNTCTTFASTNNFVSVYKQIPLVLSVLWYFIFAYIAPLNQLHIFFLFCSTRYWLLNYHCVHTSKDCLHKYPTCVLFIWYHVSVTFSRYMYEYRNHYFAIWSFYSNISVVNKIQ